MQGPFKILSSFFKAWLENDEHTLIRLRLFEMNLRLRLWGRIPYLGAALHTFTTYYFIKRKAGVSVRNNKCLLITDSNKQISTLLTKYSLQTVSNSVSALFGFQTFRSTFHTKNSCNKSVTVAFRFLLMRLRLQTVFEINLKLRL